MFSISVDAHRFAFADPLYEAQMRQIWPAGRPVHCKVTQDTDVDSVQVMIGVTHRLCPLFAGRIWLERFAAGSCFRRRIGWIFPVQARSGRDNELLCPS